MPFGLVIHGGAGRHSAEREGEYREALEAALAAGYAVLEQGGSSLDAVVAAIVVMEDAPVFNAGRGSVFNGDGYCELDASIMDGRGREAGAVAGVTTVRNPIELARAVMERTRHVLLIGPGAERFAVEQGFEPVENEYFQTERRRRQFESARSGSATPAAEISHGTVGCVALDRDGNLAAGTSTGGLSGKMAGRVGDSPVIGAGTYAANETCAVSATGQGEFFIRASAAREVAARMEFAGQEVEGATEAAIRSVAGLGGTGGLISIDREGRVAVRYNTESMARAWRTSRGERAVEVFAAEGAKVEP
jgi:beta-aspartyl-peptidase (threonine type)